MSHGPLFLGIVSSGKPTKQSRAPIIMIGTKNGSFTSETDAKIYLAALGFVPTVSGTFKNLKTGIAIEIRNNGYRLNPDGSYRGQSWILVTHAK